MHLHSCLKRISVYSVNMSNNEDLNDSYIIIASSLQLNDIDNLDGVSAKGT